MKDGIEFKMVDGKVKIATEQTVDMAEFERRISSIAAKRVNFNMQKSFILNQIEEAKKNIPIVEKNIEAASEDLEEAFQFLKSNHREDVLLSIQKKIEETEKQAAEQQANAQQ